MTTPPTEFQVVAAGRGPPEVRCRPVAGCSGPEVRSLDSAVAFCIESAADTFAEQSVCVWRRGVPWCQYPVLRGSRRASRTSAG